ncbi:MAG: hypothetical protein ACM3NT_07290 [Methylocystaceae bacterium]
MFYRIQDKIVSHQKIDEQVSRILNLRQQGMSQQEVADQCGVDRTFVSRLEGLGEVRKGRKIAVVGFPVQNRAELEAVLTEAGVDFILLMTETERLAFVDNLSGRELLNQLMELITRVRSFDVVVLLGSDQRLRVLRGVLDREVEVVGMEIGTSPLTSDVWVSPDELRSLLQTLKSARNRNSL